MHKRTHLHASSWCRCSKPCVCTYLVVGTVVLLGSVSSAIMIVDCKPASAACTAANAQVSASSCVSGYLCPHSSAVNFPRMLCHAALNFICIVGVSTRVVCSPLQFFNLSLRTLMEDLGQGRLCHLCKVVP